MSGSPSAWPPSWSHLFELAVVSQQGVGALAIDYPGGAGDVALLERALEAVGVVFYEAGQPIQGFGFVLVDRAVGAQLFEQWAAVHRARPAICRSRTGAGSCPCSRCRAGAGRLSTSSSRGRLW